MYVVAAEMGGAVIDDGGHYDDCEWEAEVVAMTSEGMMEGVTVMALVVMDLPAVLTALVSLAWYWEPRGFVLMAAFRALAEFVGLITC